MHICTSLSSFDVVSIKATCQSNITIRLQKKEEMTSATARNAAQTYLLTSYQALEHLFATRKQQRQLDAVAAHYCKLLFKKYECERAQMSETGRPGCFIYLSIYI